MILLSLKEFFDLFAHVPCCFFGEGEREDLGWINFFISTIYAILVVMIVVLPAPARISWRALCVFD
ncbi:MAG: hypothetical protein WA130_13505 [Candidatus Methanoperedens sp.]